MAAGEQVKLHGKPNDLIARLQADAAFANVDIDSALRPEDFIGRSPQQVDDFLASEVAPIRDKYKSLLGQQANLRV
jgi:adenylosuccinate lyase